MFTKLSTCRAIRIIAESDELILFISCFEQDNRPIKATRSGCDDQAMIDTLWNTIGTDSKTVAWVCLERLV